MSKRVILAILGYALTSCGGGSGGDGPTISGPGSTTKVGHFLYIPNAGSADISAFAINPSTGALSAVTGSPFTTGSNGLQAIPDPSNKFLFISDYNFGSSGPQALHGFSVNASTGALNSVPNSPYTFPGSSTASFSGTPQFHPSGNILYWINSSDYTTYSYSLSANTGELTNPVAQSSIRLGIFDSSGQHYYSTVASPTSAVNIYSIDAVTGARTLAGSQPTGQSFPGLLSLHP